MDHKEQIEEELNKKSYGEKKQAILFVIVVILLIILLLLGIGFFTFKNLNQEVPSNNETPKQETPKQEVIDLNSNNVTSTRLINIMGVLNNYFLETSESNIGYIYQNGPKDVKSLSNNYVIFTALSYLNNRGELKDNNDDKYNKKVSSILVDETIKNIFGNIEYNRLSYLGNDITCPNGKYDMDNDVYYINTTCQNSNVFVDTYNIKIIERPEEIEVYQAIAYVKNDQDDFGIYKDEKLTEKVSDDQKFKLDASNYSSYKQYKFVFKKGSDNLYHFDNISAIN